MRSTSRRLPAAIGVALALTLTAGACSKSSTTDSGGSGAGTSGTKPAGANVDYAKLSGTINGSGATFPKAFYEEAIDGFKKPAPGVTVTYGGGGSGKGKQDLADQVVDWAGTDSTIKDEDKAKYKGGTVLYFPTVVAPITVSYNLKNVEKLQLSADTLANIFQGKIKTWNDPAVAADNPGVTLPSDPIVVVHRSDGSGTTNNFTSYLKAASKEWTLDSGDTVNWPADTQAGNGNGGVAQTVKSTNGAIGYVDYSDAKASSLQFAAIKNKAGKYVAPTLEGASAAAAGAEVKPDLTFKPLNSSGDAAYPITASTYVIVYEKQTDAGKGNAVKGWVNYLLTDGQALASSVDFAPLPSSIQQQAVAQLAKLQIG